MQAWLTDKFERHRDRYVVGAAAALIGAMSLIMIPAAGILPAVYEGLDVAQYIRLAIAGSVAALTVLAIALFALRRGIASALRWAGNRDPDAVDAARAFVFDGPRRLAVRTLAFGTPLIAPLATLLLVPSHHTSALDWIEILPACEAAVVFAALNIWFSLDVLLQPLRAALGGPSAAARRTSLVGRLALATPCIIVVSVVAVELTTRTRADAGAGNLLVSYAVAGICFVVSAVVVGPLFAGGVIAPFRHLAEATKEISDGRVGTRVEVVATDELGRLAQSFNEMLDQLQASRARIVTASDTARRKVERDLHDGAQQRLILLRLKLTLLKRRVQADGLIDEISAELDAALSELRDLAQGLYPQLLEADGLAGALPDTAARATLPTTVELDGAGRYSAELEAAVYFCCVEALQNAGKHAGPDAHASIKLAADSITLKFEVADDGVGFDLTSAGRCSGLQNMTDRIGALGGVLRVDSKPGSGTRVAGEIPLGGQR